MLKYAIILISVLLIGCSPQETDSNNNNNNATTDTSDVSTDNSTPSPRNVDTYLKTMGYGARVQDSVDNIYITLGVSGYTIFDETSNKELLTFSESYNITPKTIECFSHLGHSSNADTLKTIVFPPNHELTKSKYCIHSQFSIDIKSRVVSQLDPIATYCEEH